MNYKELKKATKVLSQIENFDTFLRINDKASLSYIEMRYEYFTLHLEEGQKEKIVNTLKEIRDELFSELKELGVSEESINDLQATNKI